MLFVLCNRYVYFVNMFLIDAHDKKITKIFNKNHPFAYVYMRGYHAQKFAKTILHTQGCIFHYNRDKRTIPIFL